MMEALYERAVARKTELAAARVVQQDGLNYIDRELNTLTAEMKDRICAMTEDVERKVGGSSPFCSSVICRIDRHCVITLTSSDFVFFLF